jgi:6-pyruvoyltetrahydropterin/6-carboxytetrahydropterin synthase
MNKHLIPREVGATSSVTTVSRNADSKLQTRIGRTYRFESAHHLPLLPEGHKCKNLHGHNYRLDVVLRGEIDSRGFIKDFAEIDGEIAPLIKLVDHQLLNDVEGLENPTAEVIAAWFFARIEGCESVRVYENDNCWAEVTV